MAARLRTRDPKTRLRVMPFAFFFPRQPSVSTAVGSLALRLYSLERSIIFVSPFFFLASTFVIFGSHGNKESTGAVNSRYFFSSVARGE